MFNFLNISDARALVPIALIGLAGVAAWFLWTRARKNEADAAASDSAGFQASAGSVVNTGQLTNLALIASLFSGGTPPAGTNTSPASGPSGRVYYSAPTAPGNGSSTGNTTVSQGV